MDRHKLEASPSYLAPSHSNIAQLNEVSGLILPPKKASGVKLGGDQLYGLFPSPPAGLPPSP